MLDFQFWTMVGMMAGGFGWVITWLRSIDQRLNGIETRTAVVETKVTILETRMGFIERLLELGGFQPKGLKERTDP